MNFTRRLFRSTPKVSPEPTCPVPPPCPEQTCPVYDLKAEKEKGVQEERRRILKIIHGTSEPEAEAAVEILVAPIADPEVEALSHPPVQPAPPAPPGVHPDIVLLDKTKNKTKFTLNEMYAIGNAYTFGLETKMVNIINHNKASMLYNNMEVIRQLISPNKYVSPESLFKFFRKPQLAKAMKELLINVIDVPLKKVVLRVDENGKTILDKNGNPIAEPMLDETGKPILDENGNPKAKVNELGSIRQISANNKEAFDYFNSLFPKTGGRTRKRRKTRRRKSRKH